MTSQPFKLDPLPVDHDWVPFSFGGRLAVRRAFRKQVTYANVVSTLALIATLAGGTAYASGLVTGLQIAPHTITDRNIKAGGIGIGSLSAAVKQSLSRAAYSGLAGPAGPAGPAGAKGDTGAPGAQGQTGTVDTSNFYDKYSSDSRFDGRVAQVVRVAKSGGAFTSISAALASISDNSSAQRYVVLVAPGTYTDHVVMKPYVDLVGASPHTTKITNTALGAADGTLVLSDYSHVRDIAIDNSGGGDPTAIAVYSTATYETVLHDVSVAASNAGQTAIGVYCGCYTRIDTADIGAQNAATAKGIYSHSGGPRVLNVNVSASGNANSYGVDVDAGTATSLDLVNAFGNNSTAESYALRLTGNPSVTVARSDLNVMSSGGVWGAANVAGGTLNATSTTFEEWFLASPALSVAGTVYSRNDTLSGGVSVAGTFKSFGDMFSAAPTGAGTKSCINALKSDWTTALSAACA